MPMDFSRFGPFLMAAFVVFILYRRLRRNFGRQVLQPTRMRIRMVLFAVIGCALLPTALRSAAFLGAEIAGLAVGAALAVWGAERTRFLMHEGRLHYVPHTYTGVAVSLLFFGRLVYRFIQVYAGVHAVPTAGGAAYQGYGLGGASMVKSPLTLGLLYVLIGYYVCYYGLVLRKSKQLKPQDMETAPAVA
jgi:uncharacterized membrane protein